MPTQKPYNLEPHIEAALSYLPLVGIGILLVEKENKETRFHAFQSLFFWGASFAIVSMLFTLRIILIGALLAPLANICITGVWIYLIWKTYNKEKVKLPVIGDLAEEQANKPTNGQNTA